MSRAIKKRVRDRREAFAKKYGGTEEEPLLVCHVVDGEKATLLGFVGVETHRAVASFRGHFGQLPKRAMTLGDLLLLGPVPSGQVAEFS